MAPPLFFCARAHQAFYEPDPRIERWSPGAATATWVRVWRAGREEEEIHLQMMAIGALQVHIRHAAEQLEEYRRRPEYWREIQDQAEEMIPERFRSPDDEPSTYAASMERMEKDLENERDILARLPEEEHIIDGTGGECDTTIYTRAERITFEEEERMLLFWLASLGHHDPMLLWPSRQQ